jgi:type III secretion protein I
MDPISTLTIAPAISSGALAQTPTAPAGSGQAERFLELLQSGSTTAEPAAQGVTVDAGAMPPVGGQSVGDSILNGMRSLSDEFRGTWGNAQQMLAQKGAEMTLSDMLRMQMQLVQLSFQYELVGKSISRSTQNIESLVKIQ